MMQVSVIHCVSIALIFGKECVIGENIKQCVARVVMAYGGM
jgi:hypothetical protein